MKKIGYSFSSLLYSLPFLFRFILDRKKAEILRGLENVSEDELASFSDQAWKNGGKFVLRGKEIHVPFWSGSSSQRELFLISVTAKEKTREWERHAKGMLYGHLEKATTDIARQRAYLLGIYGTYCPAY